MSLWLMLFFRRPRNASRNAATAAAAAVASITAGMGANASAVAAHDARPAGTPVIVTRPKHEATTAPLHAGQRVTVGLTSFRVLPNYALASERASSVINLEKK